MDRKKISALLFGASLTLASASGFAFNARTQQSNYPYGSPQTQQTTKSQDRALRDAIKAKRAEVKALRKAGDPRADQAQRELDALNAQWRATRGNGKGNGRWKNGGTPYGATVQNGRQGDDEDDDYDQDRGRSGEHRGEHGQGRGHGQKKD